MSLDFHWHWTPSTEGLDERSAAGFERSAAGFLLLDYGIHLFDFVHCLVGDVQPRAVATVVSRERTLDGGDAPGLASTIIDFGGSQAVVSMNATAKGFFGHRTRDRRRAWRDQRRPATRRALNRSWSARPPATTPRAWKAPGRPKAS